MSEFPFGIDPRGPVPNPDEAVFVEVEGVGGMKFPGPTGTVMEMTAMVVVMQSRKHFIINDAEYVIITGWDPVQRILRVKVNQ
jgi:hypothetical protein